MRCRSNWGCPMGRGPPSPMSTSHRPLHCSGATSATKQPKLLSRRSLPLPQPPSSSSHVATSIPGVGHGHLLWGVSSFHVAPWIAKSATEHRGWCTLLSWRSSTSSTARSPRSRPSTRVLPRTAPAAWITSSARTPATFFGMGRSRCRPCGCQITSCCGCRL